jgi:TatD DNase family protein
MKYIDFHCHSNFMEGKDCMEIVSIDPRKFITSPYFTIGFHPWWSELDLEQNELTILEENFRYNNHCIAIGECGLDKLQGANESIQIANFEKQIELANQLNAPMIIHCVRKYDTLLTIYKNMAKTPWTIHGFKRNKILSKTLLDLNINISLAPYENMNSTFLETIHYIPINKLFLETDSDRRLSIIERYKIFADCRKLAIEDLKLQIFNNCKFLFGEKWQKLIG